VSVLYVGVTYLKNTWPVTSSSTLMLRALPAQLQFSIEGIAV
jgi:hypothetical protein